MLNIQPASANECLEYGEAAPMEGIPTALGVRGCGIPGTGGTRKRVCVVVELEIDSVRNLRVGVVQWDQCMYGLRTWGNHGRGVAPVRKRTQFMTSIKEIRREHTWQCDSEHRRQQLTGDSGRERQVSQGVVPCHLRRVDA